MIAIKRILCPTDFSDFSRHALEHAIVLARWYEAQLTLLHVYGAHAGMSADLATPRPADVFQGQLEEFAAPVRSAGIDVNPLFRDGHPVSKILDVAATLPADLLVMGTHGHGGLDRLMLGSVTEKVLRKASCPVLTVPPPITQPPAAALDLFKRILCPVDFSDASLNAVRYAVSVAGEADAELMFLHVIEGPTEPQLSRHAPFDVHGYLRYIEEDARVRLRAVIPDEAQQQCRPSELFRFGKPYVEILGTAKERHADLVVMGVHGRNPIDMMLFGSTTNHVVRAAVCPVLTLRAA